MPCNPEERRFALRQEAKAVRSEYGLHNICEFLRLLKEGVSVAAISKSLGLSREHLTRAYNCQ